MIKGIRISTLQLVVLLALACYSTATIQDVLTIMTPSSTTPGCLCFSPYVDNLTPNYGPEPSVDVITQLLNNIIQQTPFRCIEIYDLSGVHHQVVDVAHQLGLYVIAHIYISPSDFSINNIAEAIQVANQYPDTVKAIMCGNEVAYSNNDLPGTKQAVLNCKQQCRDGGVTQPIGYSDVATVWCTGAEYPCENRWDLAQSLDFMGLNEFAWWKNQYGQQSTCESADIAANKTIERYISVRNIYAQIGIPVILTESGWPGSQGSDIQSQPNVNTQQQCGVANPQNQKFVNQEIINLCTINGFPMSLFEAFDEPWKGNFNQNDINSNWGICEGTAPYTCNNVPTVYTPGSSKRNLMRSENVQDNWSTYNQSIAYYILTNGSESVIGGPCYVAFLMLIGLLGLVFA